MVIIFPIIFIAAFLFSAQEILNGQRQGFLLFILFGLSIYTTTLSAGFVAGFKFIIPFLQYSKELLVITLLLININALKVKPRFHLLDHLIFAYLGITFLYAVLPIGEQGLVQRLTAFKSISFFTVVYFAGRFMDVKSIYLNKYLTYALVLTIAAGAVVILERVFQVNLQSFTGLADYAYYFFNFDPSGNYGLNWTFESEGGTRRFASFFADPIEHGMAAVFALSVILAQFTGADNKFKPNQLGKIALGASLFSILLAFSRSPLIGYFLIVYFYALLFKQKLILKTLQYIVFAGVLYIVYLLSDFGNKASGIVEVAINTFNFSNPSSLGHLLAWVEGILSMAARPLGLGLGSSGRVGGTAGEVTGGENQFIIIGVQAGIITLALYITIYVLFIKQALRWKNLLDGKERKICLIVLLLKIGLIIPSFTTEVEGSAYISYANWFFSGLFVSIIMSQVPQFYAANPKQLAVA